MRDNISLTRPAWIEADLAKIFSDGLFPDFTALWLLIHQSRFGAPGAAITDCPLERWRERGRTEGTAAREKLRLGVEAALAELGQGFIEHPANTALRQELSSGDLSPQVYFEQLLRLVYRLIFLFAAEDRNLLHPDAATAAARRVYAEGYGVARLRERCMRRTAWDQHTDTFEGLKANFKALSRGEPRLGLPALGGLFARGQTPHLTTSRIANRRLLAAIWRLAWLRPEGQPLTRVNWRDMETEELGSVYEGLLELTPRASADARTFAFAEGGETRGHERKKTGSYYTPEALVKLLLDATLDPILDAAEARNPADPIAAILSLTILDPACGSGHFLLGSARRAAARIAKLRSPGAPSQIEFQHALREVVSRCIHGVDRNPLAVELCKVALWIEALEPGKPLTFLDARIRCGDSLIGVFDYDMLKEGIPDEAYKPLTGDDKDAARAWGKLNRGQRDGKAKDGMLAEIRPPAGLLDAARKIHQMPEDTLEQIAAKRTALARLHAGSWLHLKAACDLYVAAFFAPKTEPPPASPVGLATGTMPLTDHVWRAADGHQIFSKLFTEADRIAHALHAFHWPLEFPDIIARGGFDVVVGNPPWERIKLQEQEFFAARSPVIANAPNAAARGNLIRALAGAEEGTPERRLYDDFLFAKRTAEAGSEFVRNSGRFPLTGTGDVNTYALFAELFSRLARAAPNSGPVRSIAQAIVERPSRHDRPSGRAGVIVPTGIATDSSTSAFFGDLVSSNRIVAFYSFYEIRAWFKGTDDRKSFCILCIGKLRHPPEFAFDLDAVSDLEHAERRFSLSAEQIARINPNTKTAPVFRSRADAALTAKIYDRIPVLIEEGPKEDGGDVNPWGITFQTLFHMSNDSGLFRTEAQLAEDGWARDGSDWVREGANGLKRRVPLYEAKMIHHFDHRWATYPEGDAGDDAARDATLGEKRDPAFEPRPRYWVPEAEVTLRAARVPSKLKSAWRRRDKDSNACVRVLGEWLAGAFPDVADRPLSKDDLSEIFGHDLDWSRIVEKPFDVWLAAVNGDEMQAETSLTLDDLTFLREGPSDPIDLTCAIIERKQPRWLMGWRDIALRSVERTVVARVFPKVGVGHTLPLLWSNQRSGRAEVCLACWTSMIFDFTARLKIGGTHLTYGYLKQLPMIHPSEITIPDLAFVTPRVLELTYTSHLMRPWAEDLDHRGPPFAWEEDRRAWLRAELDAFFAMKYGLSRDELVYVLDPAKAKGPEYPSETFRVLQKNGTLRFGEYRTERLVLAAFDRLTGA